MGCCMLLFLFQLACFPDIKESEEQRFPENPTDDYDEDGFMDAEDCDDANPDITVPQTYYLDSDGDGFGSQTVSELACPSDKSDGYIPAQIRNGVEVFDCNDDDDSVNPDALEICDEMDNDCDGDLDEEDGERIYRWYLDVDQDGFGTYVDEDSVIYSCRNVPGLSPNFLDCDDENADISPNADELCDGVDNNCDTIIDESSAVDAIVWIQDADGDGFGSNYVTQRSCSQPEGYVADTNGGDCNDNDLNIHPDAMEACNTADDDCDGLVDEGADSTAPSGSSTFYADVDGDGFGDVDVNILQCTLPEGYVSNADDCDDGNVSVNPNTIWYADSDGDLEGDATSTISQCSQPSGYVSNATDCNDSDVSQNTSDADGDGTSSCAGDCDDTDASLNLSDADGDGLDSCSGDCDDSNPSIYLNAPENCNGLDDDCDGSTDEGVDSSAPIDAPTWYADADGDLEGGLAVSMVQCTQPSGYVSNSTDCDDADALLNTSDTDGDGTSSCAGDCNDDDATLNLLDADGDGMDSCSGDCDDSNPSIYLNAPENCNGLDDDCDGSTDEEDAIDKSEWYADGDGDGFGNGGVSLFACDQPAGFISVSGDCNDGDTSISPNATEMCDGIDNNCDGLSDDADANVDLNTATEFFQDADFDGFGNPLQSTFACLPLPGFVTNSDDCDDGNLLRNPNGYEYCNNIDDNCDGAIDELAVDATTYFVDSDGDGHGVLVDQSNGYDLISCPTFDAITNLPVNPTGYAESNDDCDDGDAAISPSASEICTNDVDENCDGHRTAGATDVSTFLVDADGDGFGSGERDSNGDLAYALDLCIQPYGYVPYAQGDGLDCDDGDFDVKPGAVELCNGQLDNCASDGSTTIPSDEVDNDGDGRVECTLDVDPLQWADLSLGIVGGDDCDDNDINAYPDATELCNGAFEDCNDPLYIAQSQSAPDDEIDDDGDCFVECYGFDSNTWEGGTHSCEHVDSTGQIVQETVVIGGEDCNDDNPDTYVGAAYNDPTVCAQDADGDGDADCNLVGLVQSSVYGCDFGVDLPNGGTGPDFVLIQGGLEPKGRYTLTNDFYVMTTEVTQQMWTDVMDGSGYGYASNWSYFGSGSLHPAYNVSWYDAIAFANRLSVLTGREECYANTDDPNVDYQQQFDPDGLASTFATPYDCNGFRLLTDAEWEYAARSGTTSEFWTGQGSQLGGTYSSSTSTGNETILDGVSNPLLRDYAWYGGNNDNQYGVYGSKEVGQKLPNGFGLYDMHGNLSEWTADWYGCIFPQTSADPYCGSAGSYRVRRGGGWISSPSSMRASNRGGNYPTDRNVNGGFRLGLHP